MRREFSAEGRHSFGRSHYKDLTETGNRARKVSDIQGSFAWFRDFISVHVDLLDESNESVFAISTLPVIQFVCPPKFCISIVLNFSWDDSVYYGYITCE